MAFFLVGLGGFLGAVARYAVFLNTRALVSSQLPLATGLVNLTGGFLAGFLFILVERNFPMQREIMLMGLVGFLGSYPTFSAFSLETLELYRSGEVAVATINMVGQPLLALAAVGLGSSLASRVV